MRLTPFLLLVPLLVAGCSAHGRAGTGDVAFRLIWDGTSDLDLLVEDPGGSCIYWGKRQSSLGGILDVDCNAGTDRFCDHPIENVFWPTATAPPGGYRAWVRAHALLPAEAPLAYELQVLHGTQVSWVHRGEINEHQESHGPFLHTFPGGEVALEPGGRPMPRECTPSWMRVPSKAGIPAGKTPILTIAQTGRIPPGPPALDASPRPTSDEVSRAPNRSVSAHRTKPVTRPCASSRAGATGEPEPAAVAFM